MMLSHPSEAPSYPPTPIQSLEIYRLLFIKDIIGAQSAFSDPAAASMGVTESDLPLFRTGHPQFWFRNVRVQGLIVDFNIKESGSVNMIIGKLRYMYTMAHLLILLNFR